EDVVRASARDRARLRAGAGRATAAPEELSRLAAQPPPPPPKAFVILTTLCGSSAGRTRNDSFQVLYVASVSCMSHFVVSLFEMGHVHRPKASVRCCASQVGCPMLTQTFASGAPVSSSMTSSVKMRKPGGAVGPGPMPPPPRPPPDPPPELPGPAVAAGVPTGLGAVVGAVVGGAVATTTTVGAALVRPRRLFFAGSTTVTGRSGAAAPPPASGPAGRDMSTRSTT